MFVAHISLLAFQHTFATKPNAMLFSATYCDLYYLALSDYLCCGLFLLKRLVLKQNAEKTAPFTNLFTAAIQIFNRILQEKYILFENLARKIYLLIWETCKKNIYLIWFISKSEFSTKSFTQKEFEFYWRLYLNQNSQQGILKFYFSLHLNLSLFFNWSPLKMSLDWPHQKMRRLAPLNL